MKCPNCDTNNGKTNKYCRTCGTRLETLAAREAEHDSAEVQADEVGLGEELFSVHELVDSGDLESALEKVETLAKGNPGSASAHAIAALVYERKAEQELADGNPARSHEFLRRAIDRYETVIDLNPDSAADREKLASLRLKSTGHAPTAPKAQPRAGLAELVNRVPRPVLASGAAFLVLLALAIVLTAPSGVSTRRAEPQRTDPPAEPTVNVTQAAAPESSLKVYTFPQSSTTARPVNAPPTMPIPKVPSIGPDRPTADVPPMKVPKIDQELTLVPEPSTAAKKPSAESPKQPAEGKIDAVASGSSGSSMLAQAIRLHDQGSVTEAIGAANQAIVLWNADIEAGRGVDAAKRGIANATKFISVWQDSATR